MSGQLSDYNRITVDTVRLDVLIFYYGHTTKVVDLNVIKQCRR